MQTNPALNVAQPELDLILALLAKRLADATVLAFGSRVRDWPYGRGSKPYSDLDLAVWPAKANDSGPALSLALALAELRADFEDSALPWRVDVSLAQDLPVALRQMARQHGVELQRATESSH